MKSLYKYFILFLIITSCGPKEKASNSLSIYFKLNNEIIKLSDISTVYDIIKLKDDSSNVIGNVDKLICRNGKIYTLDSYGSKSIFVFDETGELILKINNVGKGPGEYLYPNDFDINDYNGEIHVLDTNHRKLIVYNKKGVYVREIHIKFSPFSFAVTNDGKYIFSLGNYPNDNLKKIIITDSNGNIIKYSEKVHINSEFKNLMLGEQKEIHHINNKIYITPSQQNKVYIYAQDEVAEKYTLDFGKYNLPK
ncbi:MAG: 6-bladed beta-propeller, partial [Melioribacter sp.]|nr:6-bladed beta-propeller [Melioribacter sp.]